jgi:flagellar hook-length control protein FliK
MSIEHNVSTGPSKAAQSAAGHGAAKKPAGGAPAAGGFAALLMSMEADGLPPESALADDTLQDDLAAVPGAAASDPAALAAADVADAVDPALSASQAPALPSPPAAAPDEAIIVDPRTPSAGSGAVVPGLAASRSEVPSWQAQVQTQTQIKSTAQREATQGVAVDPGLPAPDQEQAVAEVQPLLRQAGWAQRLAQQRSQAADAAQVKRGEDIAARLGWQISDLPTTVGAAPQALLAAGLGEAAGLRSYAERSADRHGARGGVGEAGAFAGVAQAEGARMDVPTVAPDAGLTTEMRVAEQVSYYVGRGAQSAEMEVEGIDERPIHVSIDLQGQEARIEFRAEQAQTRQVLQDAMPHLREMLEREGLMLAGMSVGHSGTQGGQEQPGRERPGARQAQVSAGVEAPVTSGAGARQALPPGRSVDLFV